MQRVITRLKLIALCILLLLILNVNAKAQPVAYGRIVTDLSVYTSAPRRTDTVKMEFVYFPDSVFVVMRAKTGTISQWLYPAKGMKANTGFIPTDFYTKKGSPVKIIEDIDSTGWLIVSSVKFRSINRIVYKIYPFKLPNGDIVPRAKIYAHQDIKK